MGRNRHQSPCFVARTLQSVARRAVRHVKDSGHRPSFGNAVLQSLAERVAPAAPLHAPGVGAELPTISKVPGRNVHALINMFATSHRTVLLFVSFNK